MIKKWILLLLGIFFLVLAMIGIFIPLLPTTPLLLLSAACFIRSSDRLYRWLINQKIFGKYIRNYREHKAVSLRTKIVGLLFLWGTISYAIFMVSQNIYLDIFLLLIAIGVSIHHLLLKTLPKERMSQSFLNLNEREEQKTE
jgi:uncharacterized membrane protein YbaN (DUF454 family)